MISFPISGTNRLAVRAACYTKILQAVDSGILETIDSRRWDGLRATLKRISVSNVYTPDSGEVRPSVSTTKVNLTFVLTVPIAFPSDDTYCT